ncbi:MAG: T9SS type A sorting domain-containing protein, partial [Bacteroidota bacterium]
GPITGNQTVCALDTAAYSIVEVVEGITYNWSVEPAADTIIGNGTPTVTIIWGNASGEIRVLASNDCGPNPTPSILPVTVNPSPTSLDPISGPDVVCNGTNGKFYTSSSVKTVIYEWAVPIDANIVSGQGTDTIHVTWGSTEGIVTVFALNDCGETPVVTKSVGVNSIPGAAGVITGKDTICQGSGNLIYSIPSITGATHYIWSTPTDVNITSGSGTNQVTLQYGSSAQSGNITVKGTNDCGDGAESSKPVKVKNCTGIDQRSLESTIKIYPNPVSNELMISIEGKKQQLVLTFTNTHGQVVHSETLTNITPDYKKKLDVSRFTKGVYFLKLFNNDQVFIEKVIVK